MDQTRHRLLAETSSRRNQRTMQLKKQPPFQALLVFEPLNTLQHKERVASLSLFEIPELNYKKTRRKALKEVKTYKLAMMKLGCKGEPKITPSYSAEPLGLNNQFHSSTEDAAIFNLEGYKPYRIYVEAFNRKFNCINAEQRKLLYHWLFQNASNDELAELMACSYSRVSHKKRDALESFALAFDCEVYQNGEKPFEQQIYDKTRAKKRKEKNYKKLDNHSMRLVGKDNSLMLKCHIPTQLNHQLTRKSRLFIM